MKRAFEYLCLSIFFLTGCIHNDLPYPVVVPHITSMNVQDAVEIDINYDLQEVTVYVSETTDLRKIVINDVAFDVDFARTSTLLTGVHDLTKPLKFKITTYQDYDWTLKAVRNVERYFTVSGQIGSSVIDAYNCRAIANVSEGTDISNLQVTSLKLGPKDLTTYSLDPSQMKDFTDGLSVDVTAFGQTETWTLYVEETDISVQISKVNPWTTSAYVTAMAVADRPISFQYKETYTSGWLEASPEDITADGGTFTAHLKGLNPDTEYEVVVVSGEEKTPSMEFVTDPATKIPNGSFEYASLVSGSNYYKFYDPACGVAEGEEMFWGSGNGEGSEGVSGSAGMGIIITTIDRENKVDGKQSVCAQTSQMVGILAAGNLFTGQFAGLVGTEGGIVDFGRPWSTRPVALKLYCRYTTGKIDIIGGMPPGVTLSKNDYDRAQIKFAIGTWEYRKYGGSKESPVKVNTTDESTFVDFSKDPGTIANGDLIIHNNGYILNRAEKVDASTWEWAEYTIPLNYHTIDQKPTHIIISCAASQYGDYFTGCSSSKLWIDAVELVY